MSNTTLDAVLGQNFAGQPAERQNQAANNVAVQQEASTNYTKVSDRAVDKVSESSVSAAEDLYKELKNLEELQSLPSFGVEIALREDSGETIVTLVDKESGDVIRQIPPREVVEMKDRLRELSDKFAELKGVLFNNQV